MAELQLERWGMKQWLDPREASVQDAGDMQRLLTMLVSYRLQLQRERQSERGNRGRVREIERELDDTWKTATMLMSLIRTERELVR
jgi:hypothetical protein